MEPYVSMLGKTSGGIKRKIGMINGKDVFCSSTSNADLDKSQQKHLAMIVKETVETQARIDDTEHKSRICFTR